MSTKGGVAQKVWEMALPLADRLGLIIWDVQYLKEGAEWILRIYIDKPQGVGIDDCVEMSRAIDPVLDQEDPVPDEYVLEVSSPGINRRLSRPEHFDAYMGEPVRARLIRPLEDGTKELEGLLIDADQEGFELQLSEDISVDVQKKECAWVSALDDDFSIEEP